MENDNPKPKPEEKSEDGNTSTDGNGEPEEIGGRKDGLNPARYGDWEHNGRCTDF